MFSLPMLLLAAHTVAAPVQPPVGSAAEVRGAVPPSVAAVNDHLADHRKTKASAPAIKRPTGAAPAATAAAAGKRSTVASVSVPAAVAKTPLPRSKVGTATAAKKVVKH